MNKIPNNQDESSYKSGEVMSLLENMNDGIKLLAESQSHLIKKVDNLETRFDGLETRFDGLETRFDGLDAKVDKIQDDITDIKYTLSEKVDKKDFEKLEKRVIKLERAVLAN